MIARGIKAAILSLCLCAEPPKFLLFYSLSNPSVPHRAIDEVRKTERCERQASYRVMDGGNVVVSLSSLRKARLPVTIVFPPLTQVDGWMMGC
jgi:ABC-type uncharacterized transport system auxiliary subunit